MPETRERLVRAHAVREGDNLKVEMGWWLVGPRFVRLPVRFPNCPTCKEPMEVHVQSHTKAVFKCDCAVPDAAPYEIEILIEEVDPEYRAFEIKRGSKSRIVILFKNRLVRIIRR